jgi:hypothetical protein
MAAPSDAHPVETIVTHTTVASAPSNAVLKAGKLTKEDKFFKTWTESYFELTSYQMTYYNDNTSNRLERGYFMLGDIETLRFCPRKYASGSCIAVATKTRTYYLRGSRVELGEWLGAIGDACKALRYTTTLNLVHNGVHLLTLVLWDTALGSSPEKEGKKDKKVQKALESSNSRDLVHSEWLWTHERLAVRHLCLLGFSHQAEGGQLLLELCEYCWTRETREAPRRAVIALLGLGADPAPALRFYNSTDWVKEYKTDKYYTTGYVNTTTTTSTKVQGQTTFTTVQQQGKTINESAQTKLWSSHIKKKVTAPETFALLEDHPRWRG